MTWMEWIRRVIVFLSDWPRGSSCGIFLRSPFKRTKETFGLICYILYQLWNWILILPRIRRIERISPVDTGCKTKTIKTPCARCKMSLTSHWCCARLKILEQAQIFSATHTITLSGSYINRKAINIDKHLSSGWYPTTGKTATCKAKWFIPVYRLGEDGDLL